MSETIEVLVKGGAASGGPPLGPALGPTGIKVNEVVAAINEKTAAMKGMDVPVKVIIDKENKTFEISIGTPPTSALIKKELNLEKGSQTPGREYVGDITVEQLIGVAKVKLDALLAHNVKAAVKEMIGGCRTMGLKVEGLTPAEATAKISSGEWDSKFSA